jgi:lysyl-tRNA synthetase class 2
MTDPPVTRPAAGEPPDAAAADAVPEQVAVRMAKRRRIRDGGADPYPVSVPRTATCAELRERYAGLAPDTATGDVESVAGRILRMRDSGRLVFATIRDGTGELQLMLGVDQLGPDRLARWKADVDIGDHVSATGEVVSSRRGELSVRAASWQLAAKTLRPLPDKHRGLVDPEARIRHRYLDMIVNDETRAVVRNRDVVLRALRERLRDRGYLEVETPVLQAVHGGAAARPFATRLNAFDMPVYLRIALELYLKRLIVGGFERVFEIGRIFRNEGIDSTHSAEFTMLEAYAAYGDYDTMAELTRELVLASAAAFGGTVVKGPSGATADLAGPWRTVRLHDAVAEAVGSEVTPGTPEAELRRLAGRHGVPLRDDWSGGEIALELYEKLVEPNLVEPTFVRDYPVAARPLAKPHRADPRLAEAWDLVIAGVEVAVAFSELNDPVEQRRRLTEQSLRAAGGDPEAMALDEDFLLALEYGMPPTGGMGLGVDRLIQLLAGTGIRESIAFPITRPGQIGSPPTP